MLTSLTFGLYYPSFVTSQQRFLTSNTWFGSQRFAFDGRGRDLMGCGWGRSCCSCPRWDSRGSGSPRSASAITPSTRASPARASLDGDGAEARLADDLAWVGLLLTAGLAWPWLTVRKTRRGFAWLSLEGPLALDTITQQAQQVSATGEGLAGFFDADSASSDVWPCGVSRGARASPGRPERLGGIEGRPGSPGSPERVGVWGPFRGPTSN